MDSSDLSDSPITLQEYLEVKKALASSDAKVQQLMKVNNNLSEELRRLQREVSVTPSPPHRQPREIRKGVSASSVPFPPSSTQLSCFQDGGRHMTTKVERHGSGTDSDYDNTQTSESIISMDGRRFMEMGRDEDFHHEIDDLDMELDPGLPSTEDVILKTEQVTKNIQELLRAAQEFKHDSFVPCSEKIHTAVTEMASLFPKKPSLETVRSSLRLLNASAYRLQSECRKTVPPEPGAPVDYQLLTQQVIQCAYDIAKAAKQLVTITTREKKQ